MSSLSSNASYDNSYDISSVDDQQRSTVDFIQPSQTGHRKRPSKGDGKSKYLMLVGLAVTSLISLFLGYMTKSKLGGASSTITIRDIQFSKPACTASEVDLYAAVKGAEMLSKAYAGKLVKSDKQRKATRNSEDITTFLDNSTKEVIDLMLKVSVVVDKTADDKKAFIKMVNQEERLSILNRGLSFLPAWNNELNKLIESSISRLSKLKDLVEESETEKLDNVIDFFKGIELFNPQELPKDDAAHATIITAALKSAADKAKDFTGIGQDIKMTYEAVQSYAGFLLHVEATIEDIMKDDTK